MSTPQVTLIVSKDQATLIGDALAREHKLARKNDFSVFARELENLMIMLQRAIKEAK